MRLKVIVATEEESESESWRMRYADQGHSHLYRRADVGTCDARKLE